MGFLFLSLRLLPRLGLMMFMAIPC